MKVVREPLIIDSREYSREFDIERSIGCHLMVVVEHIKRTAGIGKQFKDDYEEQEKERLRTPGFIWERVMSEHSRRMVGEEGLAFPGEMMYCVKCDDVFPGGRPAREHLRSRKHKGIFFTPDAVMQPPHYRYGALEWKYTWKSSRRTGNDHINDIWEWPVQLGWNTHMIGSDYGEVLAMFAQGDYSSGRPRMEPYRFRLEWDSRELERNKAMIISAAKSEGWV